MATVHLEVMGDAACGSRAPSRVVAPDLRDYTCTRCGARLCERPQLVNYLAAQHGCKASEVPIRMRRKPAKRRRT